MSRKDHPKKQNTLKGRKNKLEEKQGYKNRASGKNGDEKDKKLIDRKKSLVRENDRQKEV